MALWYLLDSPGLLMMVLVTGAWAFTNWRRREPAITRAALSVTAVLGLATAASIAHFEPWVEGGWAMALVCVVGAYAVGCAAAARAMRGVGPRRAAWISLAAALAIALRARASMMDDCEKAVTYAKPEVAEIILKLASAEAWRPAQLSALLGLLVVGLLVSPALAARTQGPR
jgi:hypothetical protein